VRNINYIKQIVPTPLYAESVFFGGDAWLTLFARHLAPPKQSKRKHPIKTRQYLYQIAVIVWGGYIYP
jgi:hypothetical protein